MDLSKSLYIFILKIKFTNHGFLNSNKPSNEKLISLMISIYIIMFDGRKQTKFLKLCLLQSFFFCCSVTEYRINYCLISLQATAERHKR